MELIEYYLVSSSGAIHKCTIYTTDENYVSHTDTDVTIKHNDGEYNDYEVIHPRSFEKCRQERIESHKRYIERHQEELEVFEKGTDYDLYWDLRRQCHNKPCKTNI